MNEWSRLKLVTPASSPAVSLNEFKSMLGITSNDQDSSLQATLDAAIGLIEGPYGIGICLTEQTWQLSLDGFPCEIIVPLGPVQSVDSISYLDGSGTEQSLASWLADVDAQPTRVRPARGTSWPEHLCEIGSVKVEFTAGFDDVPAALKQAVLLSAKSLWRSTGTNDAILRRETVEGVGSWDWGTAESAEAVFDKTIERLMAPYRVGLYQ